ncbi:MAG: cation:dicarboxylase symporter family transporter [Nitrospiraceae bacterium]|nr:cation:dicarboxylase symporter family transporter [Nitrospiraceae bacterium]
MKRLSFSVYLIVLLSVFLGAASSWPESGFPAPLALVARCLVLFASLALFFLVLPKLIGQAMQIFVAMLLGIFAGWALAMMGQQALVAEYLGIFGALFIDLLKMVIVPLVFVSLVCGVAGIGDVRKLGPLGAKTLLYFCCTTAIAVLIGLVCVNLIQPGSGREDIKPAQAVVQDAGSGEAVGEEQKPSLGVRIQEDVLPQFIYNPVIADQPILAVIFFAILLGAALAANAERTEVALHFFKSMDHAMITIVKWIMMLAPIGVFALMAKAVATMGIDYLLALGKYCMTVVLGLFLHFCVLSFLVLPLLGRVSPLRFLRGMSPALQLAFSTSSSSATLPVTIDCASRRVGAGRSIASFVLPLGATINMDGTALYQAVASLFIAQVYGLGLTFQQQLLVFLTAVIVSVGAAGIPGASVGLMAVVLKTAGIPIEGIGIVIGVDRMLDMCRTFVNVTGDSVGTVVVARSEGAIEEPAA